MEGRDTTSLDFVTFSGAKLCKKNNSLIVMHEQMT